MTGVQTCALPIYELNAAHEEVDVDTQLYLRKILSESTLADDRIYEFYLQKLAELPDPVEVAEPESLNGITGQQFTIASLPMSHDVDILYEVYRKGFVVEDREAIQCAMHDVAHYNVPLGLSYDEFFYHLKTAFFKSAFVAALLIRIDNHHIFFGETKAWIQANCTDVPIPSRRDLTGNVQVLYRWIVELGQGRYELDHPNYSQRLYKMGD